MNPPPWDAMFTPAATFANAPASEQGNATVLDVLAPGGVRPADLPALTAAVNELLTDPSPPGHEREPDQLHPAADRPDQSGWQTLDVPVFLITCQLLLLTWLLLFLIVTDAAEARAGRSRWPNCAVMAACGPSRSACPSRCCCSPLGFRPACSRAGRPPRG